LVALEPANTTKVTLVASASKATWVRRAMSCTHRGPAFGAASGFFVPVRARGRRSSCGAKPRQNLYPETGPKRTFRISNSREPPGVRTTAASPMLFPMRDLARGELMEMVPCRRSASSCPTMV